MTAGKEESKESESLLAESNGHTAPLQARSIDVGVRGCFFWLSEHAERSMSMAERSSWMEATGKGECQDATVYTDTFNSLPGTAFAGIARIFLLDSSPLHCCAHGAGSTVLGDLGCRPTFCSELLRVVLSHEDPLGLRQG